MNLFSKVSSIVLLGGLVVSSLATVSTFAITSTPPTTPSQTLNAKDAKEKVAESKKEVKEEIKDAKNEVKKSRINHKLGKAEARYAKLIKTAEAKGLDTTKIKANIETLKVAQLKLKTDLDASAAKDVLKADRKAIKTALSVVRTDAKELKMQLARK